MFSKTITSVINGIDGKCITIETHIQQGMPQYQIVGLPSQIIRESKERVRAALSTVAMPMPLKRITQNMSPANLRKEGSQLDLALCMGILSAQNDEMALYLENIGIVGELSLNGEIKPINGILSILEGFQRAGIHHVILPEENICHEEIFDNMKLYGFKHLLTLVNQVKLQKLTPSKRSTSHDINSSHEQALSKEPLIDFSDLLGQEQALRAIEIAVSGHHNLLMVGPPGCGKTMIVERLETIMPDMTHEERLAVSKIHGIASPIASDSLVTERPIRSPHHTITLSGMLGGGRKCMPGEMSKAHSGVLVLDELTEFKREVIEALREPLSTGVVNLVKYNEAVTYPASFLMVATMNPCHCGHKGSRYTTCSCSSQTLRRYEARLSGPIFDRIDMIVYMDRVETVNQVSNEHFSSINMRNRIIKARNQFETLKMDEESEKYFERLYQKGKITMRSYDKIKRLAQTIAILSHRKVIVLDDLLEAVMLHGNLYRQ